MGPVPVRRARLFAWIALALLAISVVLALLPPPARLAETVTQDTGILARLFPHVPGWWVIARILAVVAGAALLLARSGADVVAVSMPHRTAARTELPSKRRQVAALAAAALHVAALPLLPGMTPAAQAAYMLWLLVPAALLVQWRGLAMRVGGIIGGAPATVAQVAAVVGGWIVLRSLVAWHSSRAADVVDCWRIFSGMTHLASTSDNFLLVPMHAEIPGENAVQLFFQGLPLLRMLERAPDLAWMQAFNTVWLALTAVMAAVVTSMLVHRSMAAVAAAAFLFSPFVLFLQLLPLPTIALVLPCAQVLLLLCFWRTSSQAALALLGACAGVSAGLPPLLPFTALTLALCAFGGRRAAPMVAATAALSMLAVMVPAMPGQEQVQLMSMRYVQPTIPMAVADPALRAQFSPTVSDWLSGREIEAVPEGGDPFMPLRSRHPVRKMVETVTGAMLSPLAVARWPLRLWGDVLFDPVTVALAAVALAACIGGALRSAACLIVLLYVMVTLLPGFTSSYDLPSLLRLFALTGPMAVLAAAGFRTILCVMGTGTPSASGVAAAAAAIAVAGVLVFDVVNPRILPRSSLGMIVELTSDESFEGRAAMLTAKGSDRRPGVAWDRRHPDLDWLIAQHPYVHEILRQVPDEPVPVVDIADLANAGGAQPQDVVFWSPALEQTSAIGSRVCALWPDATLYAVADATGLARLHAAARAASRWQPPRILERRACTPPSPA